MKFNLLKRIRRRKLVNHLRYYSNVKNSGSLELFARIKRELTILDLNIPNNRISKLVFGNHIAHAEISCRQFLLHHLLSCKLNQSMLLAFGKPGGVLISPLPLVWQRCFQSFNVRIAPVRNTIFWNAFVFRMYFTGLYNIVRILFKSVKAIAKRSHKKREAIKYVYFGGLSKGNIPYQQQNGAQIDFISWYLQWPQRNKAAESIRHNVIEVGSILNQGIEITPSANILPELPRTKELIHFFAWGFFAGLAAFFNILRGRWWNAIMLEQAALRYQVRLLNKDKLATEYFFNNSNWFFRPLWTYEAEKKGSNISFYFYSTNCEVPQKSYLPAPLNYGWQSMSWPQYLVWDEYQEDFVRRAVGKKPKIEIVGDIWYQDSNSSLPSIEENSIAVFDVFPIRQSFFPYLGGEAYYTVTKGSKFVDDIHFVAKTQNCQILFKNKRQIPKWVPSKYRSDLSKWEKSDHFRIVDPEIAARRVIEKCSVVISIPFTSTGIIGKLMGKPSCYYDPTGKVYKKDVAAHGVEIISGMEELASWVKSKISNRPSSAKFS